MHTKDKYHTELPDLPSKKLPIIKYKMKVCVPRKKFCYCVLYWKKAESEMDTIAIKSSMPKILLLVEYNNIITKLTLEYSGVLRIKCNLLGKFVGVFFTCCNSVSGKLE